MNSAEFKSIFLLSALTAWLFYTPVQGSYLNFSNPDTLRALFNEAVELHRLNRNAEAVKKLHRLLTQKPSYIDEENGSAWYLFGQAVLTMDGKERAFRIWLRGLQRLKKEDLVDPFLNDAFVRLAIQLDKEKHYNLITEAFYDLLARADVQRHRAMLERIHKQCEFFLPEGRQRHMERMLNKPGLNVHPGRMLLEYWRRSDLTPATLVNERLIEHLQRVEYAGQHYASDHVRGFDDRGKIYVRLGKPNRIAYAPHDILLVDNRPHEKWYYDSIARGLNFVFVDFEKGRGFERVVLDFQSEDFRQKVTPKVATDALSRVGLLPIQVRTARFQESNGATRLELYFGLRKKDLMVKSLEPLLPTDTLRVKLVTTIENSSSWPTSTDRQTVAEFTGNDRLEDDMLVFWLATTTHQDSFYVSGQVETWFSSFGTEFTQEANASLQNAWQNSHSHSEKLFKLSAFRTELNKALRAEGAPLLMSDLQLAHQVLVDPEHPTRNKGNLKVEPYPFQRVFRNQLLFLYFEIYGLTLSPEGEAKYRIAYETEVVKPRRNLWAKVKSIFGGKARGKVRLESDFSADNPNPREWIGLDLKALSAGEVKLTVTVTDLHSGAVAERFTTFELL